MIGELGTTKWSAAMANNTLESETKSLAVMSVLSRLEAWFAAQCNGEWEHVKGVSITSTDNPGWWVKIDLAGTPLGHRSFAEVSEGVDRERHQTGPRWINCRIEESTWHGAGDETKLERILETFVEWALGGIQVQMVRVSSSAIDAVGYDPATRRMKIQFRSGKAYDFCGVPEQVHAGLMNALSKGTYYNDHIKDRYQC